MDNYSNLEKTNPKIVFENDNLSIVDKPWQWVTTDEGRVGDADSIESWSRKICGNKLDRGGVVHRLDKGTSGLVLIAKNDETLKKLKKMMKAREIKKTYLALVGGDLPQNGTINMPIGRSRYSFAKYKVDEDGKMAITEFRVLDKYSINNKIYSLVEIGLKTGRTHQIRVHFNYLGWPLAGDKVYSGQSIPGLDRQFLHAWQLEFENIKVNTPLAKDLSLVLEEYEKIS